MPTIDYLLRCLAEDGGEIVSTASCSEDEIKLARDENRLCVLDDGLGYILRTTESLKKLVLDVSRLTLENMKLRGELVEK